MNEIDQFGLNEQDVQAPQNAPQHDFIQEFVGTPTESTGTANNALYVESGPVTNVVDYSSTTLINSDYMEGPVRAKEINISPLPHGYLVRVGCQSFAFEDHKKMMKYINQYLDNPADVEAKFYSGKLFKN